MSATPKSEAKRPTFYVTTPIYYANGHPHLGNTYTTTLGDMLTRFYRYRGYDTFFLTGTDEHGDKVQQAAEKAGQTPLQFTDEVSELFKRTWAELDLEYDRFIRTTEPEHKKVVQDLLTRIHQQGDIYFGQYEGLYCVGCERFLTEKELVDGKCPDHQTVPQVVREQNYFFRMEKYRSQVLAHIEAHPDFIRPERYRNEVLAMLREPLEDLCISRPKSRLTWGIELPFDANYVTYVWFDALINYLTGVDCPKGDRCCQYWPHAQHLIGKDILKPHGVFWPTMLLALGLPLYKHLNVHGFWVTPTGKMSKSLGNVVNPVEVKNKYGMDVFRYFIFREMAFGLDGSFSAESLEARYNADLGNNLGNLVSRSLAMLHKYREGVVPQSGAGTELESELRKHALACVSEVNTLIDRMEIHRALETIWALISAGNVYVDRTKPWSLAKEEKTDQNAARQLDTVLYHQVELLRLVAGLLTAFIPKTSQRILTFLGFEGVALKAEQTFETVNTWGRLKPGVTVQKGEVLFPRIETVATQPAEEKTGKKKGPKVEQAATQSGEKPAPKAEDTGGLIAYEDFAKIDLRVGQILEAQRVEKSEKLLVLKVDVGDPAGPRQIVAGIGKSYEPTALIGRKVAVVANLKPAKLMGNKSEGMLLAASNNAGMLELINVGDIMSPGDIIK